ncbi:MAG: hypothetical protein E7500_03680 [Ruminococcus sp.]|nr:hypothetical protein [Ruminococcus sp.]
MKKLSYLLLLSLLLTGCKSDNSSVNDETTTDTTEFVYNSSIVFSADVNAEDSVIDEISDILSNRITHSYPHLEYATSVDYDNNTITLEFNMDELWHEDTAEILTKPNYLEIFKGASQEDELVLTNEDIHYSYNALVATDNDYAIYMYFNDEGIKKFSDATAELAGTDTPMSIWIDDELIISPLITVPIYDGQVTITGGFDYESAQELALNITPYPLPYDISISEEKYGEIIPIT